MEQKAKRVGKFNIIDIIAVILIVAVVAFGAWKLLGSSGGTAAEDGGMVKVTYVVKCEGVPTELYGLPGKSHLLFHWQILLCIQAGFHPVFSSQYSESASFCKWSFFSFSFALYGSFTFPF